MAGFRDLIVWQKSLILVELVYELCRTLPDDEKFGLCSQMKRSAISIPSNIAEGYRRNNRKEYKQFCGIALGSSAELETQLILTQRLFKKSTKEAIDLCLEIQKMLATIISKL